MASKAQAHYTSFVLVVGTAFFLRSAYILLTLPSGTPSRASKDAPLNASAPKLVSQSVVSNATYIATLEDCQATSLHGGSYVRPKLRAGALLKLIDVAAGVAARRHAGTSCVTISVDSVLFLKPIFLGDLIHLSASVNRAWGTSMEIGVKVMKSDECSKSQEYVSHSYLTFVAIKRRQSASSPASTSSLSRLWRQWVVNEDTAKKPTLAPIKTSSRLEARRHLLAGRRRAKRIEDTERGEARDGVSIEVKGQFRREVMQLLQEKSGEEDRYETSSERQQRRLKSLEIEYMIRAMARQEDGIQVRDGQVEVNLPGDESFSHSEEEIRRTAAAVGVSLPGDEEYHHGRRLSVNAFASTFIASASPSLESIEPFSSHHLDQLDVSSTLTTTMHLVFPQHTNSHSIIFGGNTMSWSEDVAIMACRNIAVTGLKQGKRGSWKTVAMDGLEFNVKVAVGELMILSALVVKTYRRSLECYVLVEAESLEGQRRFTNDALFTLALDNAEDKESTSIASTIVMPPHSAMESFANASTVRRQQRLELKMMLTRIYG